MGRQALDGMGSLRWVGQATFGLPLRRRGHARGGRGSVRTAQEKGVSCLAHPLNITWVRLELLQEARIVLKEEAKVIHPVAEHGYTLYPHAEGETTILTGVDSAGLKHIRVYHAAPEDL